MDYKDYLSGFGKGLDKDIESFKQRSDAFMKQYTSRNPGIADGASSTKAKPTSSKGKTGILMTDIDALAKKCKKKRSSIETIFNSFIEGSALIGIHWELLDANQGTYEYAFEEYTDWRAYDLVIEDFICGMGLEPSENLGLFIIGGDDIIPMPKVDCPLAGITNNPLDVDYMYCFLGGDSSVIRCNVGRFPLENGFVKDGLELIEDYFNKCLATYDGVGLDVNKGVMTSTESWLPSSHEMIRDLPIQTLVPEYNCTDKNLFVSPKLDSTDEKTQAKFNEAIGDADFLMFNLHGSDGYENASYYGEDKNHRSYPEAFTSDNIFSTTAIIINSTACYGGRYVGYDRGHSLLLQGIYGSALLYTASCTTALGRGNGWSETVDLLMPAGMSETLLKLYSLYLYRGIDAGQALLKAKTDYFQTCRETDGENESLATILMFNLYGNPLLNMKPKMEKDNRSKSADIDSSKNGIKLSTGVEGAVCAVTNEVREQIDSNLDDIRETIKDKLYKEFGLEPEDFAEMNTIVQDGVEKGYVLTYSKNVGLFTRKVFAKTDLEGNVKDIIHTK